MLKVNEFERDAEYRQHRDKIYRRDAVETYRYDGNLNDLLDDYDFISECIEHHLEAQVPDCKCLMITIKDLTSTSCVIVDVEKDI